MKYDPKKSFGYPVLRELHSGDEASELDYPNLCFEPLITAKIDIKRPTELLIDFSSSCPIQEIDEQISLGKASFFILVSCNDTFYRKLFEVTQEFQLKLQLNELRGKVSILPMILSTDNIKISPKEMHSDYHGVSYSIPTSRVLAWASEVSYSVEKQQFKNIRSLFETYLNTDIETGALKIDLDDETIRIGMDQLLLDEFTKAGNDSKKISLLSSTILSHALKYAIDALVEDRSEYSDYRWAEVLEIRLDTVGYDLEEMSEKSLEATMELLGFPLNDLAVKGFEI